jgi:hypothetical protein
MGAGARRFVVDFAEDGLAAKDGLKRGGDCDGDKGQGVQNAAGDFHEVVIFRETR